MGHLGAIEPVVAVRILRNLDALAPDAGYPARLHSIQSIAALETAAREIRSWPGYLPTPLVALSGLAARTGIARLWYKDESERFGLGSFKALGGAYAVFRLLAAEIQRRTCAHATSADLIAGHFAEITRELTVTCATDGNHGRAVAWAAQRFGCRCAIYVHARVSAARCEAIARYGARIVRTAGNYDDSVRQAANDARTHGWFVVSDTSYDGYVDVPRDVMQGYALMVRESVGQLPDGEWPTHVFVQGGVGGLAAAVCAYLWESAGPRRPRFIVVEPDQADCLFRSAEAGTIVSVPGELDTLMAGLACGEPSLLAWRILELGANDFMTIPDRAAIDCMRMLAAGESGDSPIVAGESAVAGLAGMLAARAGSEVGLSSDSRVLVFGTEGATDPELYTRLVGATPAAVRERTWPEIRPERSA